MADDTIKVKLILDDGALDKAPKKAKSAGAKIGAAVSQGINSSVAKLGGLLAGALAFRKLGSEALAYEKALAEVSTITDGLGINNKKLSNDLIGLSAQFGTTAAVQAKSFYQIISAGITDATKANNLLIAANKLAIGGLTSTESAIDLLTSSVNAFQKQGLTGAQAADILFGTVKAGKTRIEELQASLGQILPTASAIGVSFVDTNAALAQLTTRGVSTSEAVTQLNAVFTAVLKKQEAAKKLGPKVAKAFSLQALQTKGLTKFLKDLNGTLGGSATKLTKLLGRAEGSKAILTLAGDGFEGMAQKVQQLKASTGAADEAFQKINKTMGQQFKVSGSTASAIFFQLGKDAGVLTQFLTFFNSKLQNILDGLRIFGGLGGTLQATMKLIQIGFIDLGISAVESIQSILNSIPKLGPAAIAAISAVSPAAGAFLKAFGSIGEGMDGTVDKMKASKEAIEQEIVGLVTTLDELPKGEDGRVKNPLSDLTAAAVDTAEKLPTALESIKDGFKDVFGFMNKSGEVANSKLVQLAANTTKQLRSIGGKFAKGFAGSFAAVGAALANGEDAFAAFGKAILGVFGKIAIETGTVIFLQGLGTFNPAQVGTGLALITLGGALQAIGGGGGGGGAPSPGSGSVANADFESPTFEDEELQEPQTVVNVNIDGVVSDPSGVALQLKGLLDDLEDSNGGLVVNG